MDSFPSPSAHNKLSTIPLRSRRKLSIPVTLLVPTLGNEQIAFRRRFSNVGDAVTRKLSTIGWIGAAGGSPPEEIVAVGRAICTLYVRTKLKRAGVFNRKLGLTRVRSAVGPSAGSGALVKEIYPGFSCACHELERMHPNLFSKVSRQIGRAPEGGVAGLLVAFGHYLLRSEPTWGKIIAIYCVAGGLAVDCVRQGHNEYLHIILEDMTELLEDRIAHWLNANGGWSGLSVHCRPQDQGIAVMEYFAIFGLVAVILIIAYFVVKFCVQLSL